eukprot:1169385-Karenia_brevis.AAC.1
MFGLLPVPLPYIVQQRRTDVLFWIVLYYLNQNTMLRFGACARCVSHWLDTYIHCYALEFYNGHVAEYELLDEMVLEDFRWE